MATNQDQETPPKLTPEQAAEQKKQALANVSGHLNEMLHPGDAEVSALFQAKKDYLKVVMDDLASTPAYKAYKTDPKVFSALKAELANKEGTLDKNILDSVPKAAEKGGNPKKYKAEDDDSFWGNLFRSQLPEWAAKVPFFGGILSLALQAMPDAYDKVSEFVNVNLLGKPPKYTKEETMTAGVVDKLSKPISVGEGRKFSPTPDVQDAVYDQMSDNFNRPLGDPSKGRSAVQEVMGDFVQNSDPIPLSDSQKLEAQKAKDQMAQANASGAQHHEDPPHPGSTMVAANNTTPLSK
jgi:hypothetical protein